MYEILYLQNWVDLISLGQWLNFKLFGITYLVGKIKFKLCFFRVHWLSELLSFMETPQPQQLVCLGSRPLASVDAPAISAGGFSSCLFDVQKTSLAPRTGEMM